MVVSPMSDVKHWSYSQVDSWLSCGKKYELSRLRGAPQSPTEWAPAGTALHDVADKLVRGEVGDLHSAWVTKFNEHVEMQVHKTQTDPDFWRKAGRVSKDKPNKEDVVFWMGEGARQLALYATWLQTSGYTIARLDDGTILSELETTTRFGDVEVKGFCDAVFNTPDGRKIVVDLKSGTRIPNKTTQLGLYKVALLKEYGVATDGGSFFMTRKGELTDEVDLHQYTEQYFTTMFAKAEIARENDIFIPNPGDACRICDVSSACFVMSGHESWKYDSLNPQYQSR